ncbi:hypothetical protein SAMN05192555_11715 [Franzmannia pantelleriensis]|uniref:Uncharacterized protein n=1 Tax=Franzmannia pantelleriensis TaxID=48727 RepID=A0A1G9V517_9GAMM|nr:hypothetical protein [Halomonas pantelleriensis]SDM67239.1 hypothetical protein SAMN05192555_11715 [Halomonas pantelleriensis]
MSAQDAPPAAPTRPDSPSLRQVIAGVAILAGLIWQILLFTGAAVTPLPVGYLLWFSVVLLWRDIPTRSRRQAGVLIALGAGMLLAARLGYAAEVAWPWILDGNTYVVAMLVGVSFISLIGSQSPSRSGTHLTGWRGVLSTWFSVHLLGSILNLSTVFMVGDRLRGLNPPPPQPASAPLSPPQILALNRGLSSAAFWSPFFASMGVVMSLAPQMNFLWILAFGLPLGVLSGLFTSVELNRRFDLSNTPGFAMSPANLLMPVAMASLVMLFHYGLTPRLSIVSIITFLLPAAALATNLPQGLRWTRRRIVEHTRRRLPSMRGEISLFLAAGLFTQGLSTLIAAVTGGEWVLFEHFGAAQAMLSYAVIVVSAIAGLHPIIGVSTLASMLDLEGSRYTLLAFVALASWGVGTAVGPLSGINLSLQGRYGVSGYRTMRLNAPYAAIMSLAVLAGILLLDQLIA